MAAANDKAKAKEASKKRKREEDENEDEFEMMERILALTVRFEDLRE